jgi:hypothetical protein
MLSTAADALQLAQAAPWLAVGVLSLLASAWVWRQNRRQLAALKDEVARSGRHQGERLGDVEDRCGLLDLRRRQVEWVLLDDGLELPYWPPDGADQPRPRRRRDVDEDLADELSPETIARRLPVPPLDPAVAARHRREP